MDGNFNMNALNTETIMVTEVISKSTLAKIVADASLSHTVCINTTKKKISTKTKL